MRTFAAVVVCAALLSGATGICAGPVASEGTVQTNFTVLIGFPAQNIPLGYSGPLVSGTVIPLTSPATGTPDVAARQVVERSLSFAKATEKLWSTFRLDPNRRRQAGLYEPVELNRTVQLPVLEEAGIHITATLMRQTAKEATYRIIFKQEAKSLADSTVTVARGGRAVVGGMNGAAAPYIFLFIEPEPVAQKPVTAGPSATASGITAPQPIIKVNPKYPEEAKKAKVQGAVVLELEVDEEGKPRDIKVLETPDPGLAEAAIGAVRQWKFKPAQNSAGRPVRVRTAITVNFQLR